MIKVKLDVVYKEGGRRINQLIIGNSLHELSMSQLTILRDLLNTYIEMEYVVDKTIEVSI